MKVQGRDCTLTVAKDDNYYPLPYSEETVRQTSKGYLLPCVICKVTVKRTLLYNINKAGNKLLTKPLGKPYKVSELFIPYTKYE